MTIVYRVVKDGAEVLRSERDEYVGLEPFGEYIDRPTSGTVELYLNNELIGVQTSGED